MSPTQLWRLPKGETTSIEFCLYIIGGKWEKKPGSETNRRNTEQYNQKML